MHAELSDFEQRERGEEEFTFARNLLLLLRAQRLRLVLAPQKEEERRFGENLRPDVREEEFCSPADNEGEESAGNSVVGFFNQLSLLMSVL